MKTNWPIITFFQRTWMLTIFMLVSNYAVLSRHVWYWIQLPAARDGTPGEWVGVTLFMLLGAVLYVPAISSVVFWVALLSRHLYWRQTIDSDVNDGTYLADWKAVGPVHRIWVSNVVIIGIIIALCILCSSMAKGAVPDQRARWDSAQINPHYSIALDVDVALYTRLASRYQRVTDMREHGVPAPVLFCLHQRESSGSFLCHPHEGSPLTGRTRFVPKGRLPLPAQPPFTFEQSAEDAYYVCDKLDRIDWTDVAAALQGIESFNGIGYQKYHPDVPSPYLWAGTNLYVRGKYTGDGHFDRIAVDRQLGCVAILKRMEQRGIRIGWNHAELVP